ncbi:MAG: M24 family metallopeptidase [Methanobacteriota archaeon]
MKSRVRRIFAALEEKVDAIVLAMGTEPHLDQAFFYATDLVSGGLFEGSVAVLHRDGGIDLVTSPLEESSARRARDVRVHVPTGKDRGNVVTDLLSGHRRLGVNGPEITEREAVALRKLAPKARFLDVGAGIRKARLTKDRIELSRMRRAARIASAVARRIPSYLRRGTREYEVAAAINYEMQRLGSEGPSFRTIVAFGPNAAEPHYGTGRAKLARNTLALCDFGAYYEHYASDITRTFPVGRVDGRLRKMYDVVLSAHGAAVAAVKPGVDGGTVHKAAERVIDASEFRGKFIHSVGHTLGLAVHDGGTLHPRVKMRLVPGMVVTIEPGVYVPCIGGVRIEDDVLVTSRGRELLTDAPRAFRAL